MDLGDEPNLKGFPDPINTENTQSPTTLSIKIYLDTLSDKLSYLEDSKNTLIKSLEQDNIESMEQSKKGITDEQDQESLEGAGRRQLRSASRHSHSRFRSSVAKMEKIHQNRNDKDDANTERGQEKKYNTRKTPSKTSLVRGSSSNQTIPHERVVIKDGSVKVMIPGNTSTSIDVDPNTHDENKSDRISLTTSLDSLSDIDQNTSGVHDPLCDCQDCSKTKERASQTPITMTINPGEEKTNQHPDNTSTTPTKNLSPHQSPSPNGSRKKKSQLKRKSEITDSMPLAQRVKTIPENPKTHLTSGHISRKDKHERYSGYVSPMEESVSSSKKKVFRSDSKSSVSSRRSLQEQHTTECRFYKQNGVCLKGFRCQFRHNYQVREQSDIFKILDVLMGFQFDILQMCRDTDAKVETLLSSKRIRHDPTPSRDRSLSKLISANKQLSKRLSDIQSLNSKNLGISSEHDINKPSTSGTHHYKQNFIPQVMTEYFKKTVAQESISSDSEQLSEHPSEQTKRTKYKKTTNEELIKRSRKR